MKFVRPWQYQNDIRPHAAASSAIHNLMMLGGFNCKQTQKADKRFTSCCCKSEISVFNWSTVFSSDSTLASI